MDREHVDSREAFSAEEQMAYEAPKGWECIEDDDYEEMCDYFDNLEYDGPDEYTEWQDYMGGDDWDHGQFDECDW